MFLRGVLEKIRTSGLWFRKPTLYPTELRDHILLGHLRRKWASMQVMKKSSKKTIFTLIGLTIFFLCIALIFESQFRWAGDAILTRFGLPGLVVTITMLDYFLQPFPPDILVYSYVLSEGDIPLVALLAGMASVLGGVIGYFTGWFLEHEGAVKFIKPHHYDQARELFEEHGFWAVLIGALTPVPFNVICWCAGIFKMPFRYFVLSAIVTRGPRFLLVGLIAIWAT